ncbi:hypothetical protein LguiA_032273 [Lonicera macranthoides]
MESISARFEEQINLLKHRFPENPAPGVVSVVRDPREKGLLPTPGTVVEFQARFEQLKSGMLERWPTIDEGLLTNWFMVGLKYLKANCETKCTIPPLLVRVNSRKMLIKVGQSRIK